MPKIEAKVAWAKDDPFTVAVLDAIRTGGPIEHAQLLAAVDDPDHRKIFDIGDAQPLKKENFVIFQYAVLISHADGRIATFERAKAEEGQERITSGHSILISKSTPDPPHAAVPRIIRQELCLDRRALIGNIEPIGMALNQLPSKANGRNQPFYLLALYHHQLPEDVRLHGLFKESPDTFVAWRDVSELPGILSQSGYVDQLIGRQLAKSTFTKVDQGAAGIVFSPDSRLQMANIPLEQFDPLEYSHGFNVFLSHSSRDSFAAFALYRFLVEESSRKILPTMDLFDLREGKSLDELETQITAADGIILIITETLVRVSRERKTSGETDYVQREIELAKRHGKPIIGFKLGTLESPHYLPEDIVSNDRAIYGDWLNEVRRLVEDVQSRFNR